MCFIWLLAQGLSEGDEHPTDNPHGYGTLPLPYSQEPNPQTSFLVSNKIILPHHPTNGSLMGAISATSGHRMAKMTSGFDFKHAVSYTCAIVTIVPNVLLSNQGHVTDRHNIRHLWSPHPHLGYCWHMYLKQTVKTKTTESKKTKPTLP